METKPVRDELITAGDLEFHMVQWGQQGPPVVCIHGLTANAFCFQAYAEMLAAKHRVLAYDLRGRGESAKPPQGYNIPQHAEDLARLLELWQLERPIIIGHSLGAMIALYFASHYPDRLSKLVLVDAGAPLPWETVEGQPLWLTASLARLGLPIPSFETYRQNMQAAPFLGAYWNRYMDLYIEHDVRRLPDGSVVAKAYRDGIIEEGQQTLKNQPQEQWPRVQVPTLLLRAGQGMFTQDDQLLPEANAQAIQDGIANCRYHNFPELNHYTIIFGVSEEPALLIRDFVDEPGTTPNS